MAIRNLINLAPGWTKVVKVRALFVHHKHDLPLCRPDRHDPSCASHGKEFDCISIVKGFDMDKKKFVFGAQCTHLSR